MFQLGKGQLKVCWTSMHNKKSNFFLRTLCAFSIVVLFSKIRALQPHTFYARLLVFDKTLAQPHFAVANGSNAVMSVFFYSPVLMRSLIFFQL